MRAVARLASAITQTVAAGTAQIPGACRHGPAFAARVLARHQQPARPFAVSPDRIRGVVAPPVMLPVARNIPNIATAATEAATAISARSADAVPQFMRLADAFCREPRCNELANELVLPADGVLDTRSHAKLFAVLANKTSVLARGEFVGHGAGASQTLLGHRGIGKSTVLRIFAATAPLVFPNVIPVYVNFYKAGAAAATELLMPAVVEAVARAGVATPGPASLDGLIPELQRSGKFVLLLVDELDSLYMVNTTHQPDGSPPIAAGTLWQLGALGDNPAGRVITLLCGSSAVLPDLITANGKVHPDMVSRYPLLAFAPNLNGQKFRSMRIESDPPTSLAAVARINRLPADEREWTPEERRIISVVAFVAGATARNCGRVWRSGGLDLEPLLGELNVMEQWEASDTLHTMLGVVFDAVMTALWQNNEELMAGLVDAATGELRHDAVATGEWARRFRPLDMDEIIRGGLEFPGADASPQVRLRQVAMLADKDYFSLDFADGRAVVYPYSMWGLVCHHAARSKRGAAKEGLAAFIKSTLGKLGDAAATAAVGELASHLM